MGILAKTIGIVIVATLGLWLVARMFGYELALLPSLVISIALTALLNLGAITRSLRAPRTTTRGRSPRRRL